MSENTIPQAAPLKRDYMLVTGGVFGDDRVICEVKVFVNGILSTSTPRKEGTIDL